MIGLESSETEKPPVEVSNVVLKDESEEGGAIPDNDSENKEASAEDESSIMVDNDETSTENVKIEPDKTDNTASSDPEPPKQAAAAETTSE